MRWPPGLPCRRPAWWPATRGEVEALRAALAQAEAKRARWQAEFLDELKTMGALSEFGRRLAAKDTLGCYRLMGALPDEAPRR